TPINMTIDQSSWTYDAKHYHLVNGSRMVEVSLPSGYHTVSICNIVNIVQFFGVGQMVKYLITESLL
ncbi:MAG: hypothetical protein WCC17_00600, partial [Candidatus Nitrosopolaris sp.]